MSLVKSLNAGVSGLNAFQAKMDVIGNNIANAGTNGYKSSNVQFTTQLARTLSVGSSPQGTNGGTNPLQVGLGASTATVFRDFSQGAITSSTSPSDLAIEGAGFDLPNPFAGDLKDPGDLFQRVVVAIAQPEAEFDDLPLAIGQRLEQIVDSLAKHLLR